MGTKGSRNVNVELPVHRELVEEPVLQAQVEVGVEVGVKLMDPHSLQLPPNTVGPHPSSPGRCHAIASVDEKQVARN